jgi:hypothetical protein
VTGREAHRCFGAADVWLKLLAMLVGKRESERGLRRSLARSLHLKSGFCIGACLDPCIERSSGWRVVTYVVWTHKNALFSCLGCCALRSSCRFCGRAAGMLSASAEFHQCGCRNYVHRYLGGFTVPTPCWLPDFSVCGCQGTFLRRVPHSSSLLHPAFKPPCTQPFKPSVHSAIQTLRALTL